MKYIILGGDERFFVLMRNLLYDDMELEVLSPDIEMFAKNGISLKYPQICGKVEILDTRGCTVILPIPFTRDGKTLSSTFSAEAINVNDILKVISHKKPSLVIGYLNNETEGFMGNNDIAYVNLEKREDFAVYNAFVTAEGAINKTGQLLKSSMFRKKIVITGYGRIAKLLGNILKVYGADVTYVIRKLEGRVWAEVMGYSSVDFTTMNSILPEADIIYNTVPWQVFKADSVSNFKKGALYMELAGNMGGLEDRDIYKDRYRFYEYLSIPAKYCPDSAGEILYKTVKNIMEERVC
jgi:dipicolinate synthase subunit A